MNKQKQSWYYLGGKISGTDLQATKAKFLLWARILSRLKDVKVITPYHIVPFNLQEDEEMWSVCMQHCLNALKDEACVGIILFDDWEESPGARIEMLWAERLGKSVEMIDSNY